MNKLFKSCKKKRTNHNNGSENSSSISISSDSVIFIDEDNSQPKSRCEKIFTLRNSVFGISIFDLVISIACSFYFLILYFSEETIDKENFVRFIDLYFLGGIFCGLFVFMSIVLLVGAIMMIRIISLIWILITSILFVLIGLSYITSIAPKEIVSVWGFAVLFLIGGIYKLIENFIVYAWFKDLKVRRQIIPQNNNDEPEHPPGPGPTRAPGEERPVGEEDSESNSPSPSSSLSQDSILIHPLHNPPYNQFMGYGPIEAQGGLFDFGRRRKYRYRDELVEDEDTDSAL